VKAEAHSGIIFPADAIKTFYVRELHCRIPAMPERLNSVAIKHLTETSETLRMAIG
jgi:hypothetical protein